MTTVNYDGLWSKQANLLKPGRLQKVILGTLGIPGLIGMHGGLPPAAAFPLTDLVAGLQYLPTTDPKLGITDPRLVASAQQYNMSLKGLPDLVNWVTNMNKQLHDPPSQVDVVLSNGSTHAINVVLSLLLNPGDCLLVEEFTWSHALESIFAPPEYDMLSVRLDEGGLVPAHLEQVLQERQASGKAMPKVLYTIPTGQNPTSSTISWERKQEVYQLCRQYNIIILEDDAYVWLHFPNGPSHPAGLDLPRGYLGLDVDGRVVRVDTFAKLLGPGFRLGWISGAPQLIGKAALAINTHTVGPNSFSQVVLSEALKKWGREGFLAYLKGLQQRYSKQAAVAHEAALEHMKGLATWAEPKAGMFMWIKLEGIEDADVLAEDLIKEGVAVVPGGCFSVASATSSGTTCPYIRVSFAGPTEEQLRDGFRKIGGVLTKRS